jgi:hypothetical protein
MRKIFLLLAAAVSAEGSMTLVQTATSLVTCAVGTTTNCSVAIATNSAGNALVAVFHLGGPGNTITGVSASPSVGTWVHAGQSSYPTTGPNVDIWYITSANTTSGTNPTVTGTLSQTGNGRRATVYEIQPSSGCAITYDTKGTATSASATSASGIALTLGGSNDFIVQALYAGGATPSVSISGGAGYTIDSSTTIQGVAHAINTANGTAPTWSLSVSAYAAENAIAMRDSSCSSGTAPTVIYEQVERGTVIVDRFAVLGWRRRKHA